jgi:protocatechuate 3,4-dioxygenase beta subunit
MADERAIARRPFLTGAVAAAAGILGVRQPSWAQTERAPTPACADDDEPTPAQTEGPFFTPNSPQRSNLREDGMAGTPIRLAGTVLTRSCRPVPGALVELWHADQSGNYDTEGFRLRGHVFTGPDGGYGFETIVPGLYPGRPVTSISSTRHPAPRF